MIAIVLLSGLACTPEPTDTAGNAGGTDTADSSADSGDSGADTADSGGAPVTVNHILTAFTVAEREEGFDLDGDVGGDQEADNAIWPLANVLNPLIAEGQATAQHVGVIQLADVDSWADDAEISVGLFSAIDADGDGTDNATGSETVDPGPSVDETGRAVVATQTPLTAGNYLVELATGSLTIGSYTLEFATGVQVFGETAPESERGVIGFGVSIEALQVALTAEGVSEEMQNALIALADLDLDQDGTPDAISMAFRFEGAEGFLGS